MKVNATIAHRNIYGDAYEKQPGDVYELPDGVGAALIASEIVSEVAAKPAKPATAVVEP